MIYLLDRDERIKSLPDVWGVRHTQALNRESVLELNSLVAVDKYEHIIYQDASNRWHEFIVSGVEECHDQDGSLYYTVYADSVLTELIGDWIDDRRIVNQSATTALTRALEGTRWSVGTVAALGNATVNYYRESVYSALGKIVRAYVAELQIRIVVTNGRVSARYIDLLTEVGSDTGARFEWSRNVLEIKREILRADVITALHGYGRGAEIGDGFGRRIDFADINGGLSYIADEDARRQFGRMSSVRSWEALNDRYAKWSDVSATGLTWQQVHDTVPFSRAHRHGKIEFDDITDPAALLGATQSAFESLSKPQVSYTAKVVDLSALARSGKMSFTWADIYEKYSIWSALATETWGKVEFDESVSLSFLPVSLGDTCAVIDDDLGLELKLRVVQIVRNPLEPLTDEVTLGQMTGDYARTYAQQERIINNLRAAHGVTRMVSEDGKSWIDYSVPEIYLDGDDGNLRIDTDVIFQLHDELGRMVAGFTELGGQKGLFTKFMSNTPDGAGGYGTIGFGPDRGRGYQFQQGDHSFMLTFDVNYGVQFYVDNEARQAWLADGSTIILGRDGKFRIWAADDGGFFVYDENDNQRLALRADGSAVINDNNGKIRLNLAADGSNHIYHPSGVITFYQDNTQTTLQAPVAGGSSIQLTATGATKTVGGVTTYL